MFTNYEQYTGQVFIPQNECLENEHFLESIFATERQILENILGYCLYSELLENLIFNVETGYSELKVNAPQHIIELVLGVVYDNVSDSIKSKCGCGCNYSKCDKKHWKGLLELREFSYIKDDCGINNVITVSKKFSFLTYYCYADYITHNSVNFGNLGSNDFNATNNNIKISNALISFYNHVKGCNSGCDVSLYTYLSDNIDKFPKWEGDYICSMQEVNIWGLK